MNKLLAIILAVNAWVALSCISASAAGAIYGTVKIEADGSPVAGALVVIDRLSTVKGRSAPFARLETGQDGSFAVEEVPSGTYVLRSASGSEVQGSLLEVEDSPVELSIALIDLDQTDGESGSLSGEVRNADGLPVAGAKVVVLLMEANNRYARPFTVVTTYTDGSGRFSYDRLPVGTIGIVAAAHGYGAVYCRVRIRAKMTVNTSLTLNKKHEAAERDDNQIPSTSFTAN